MLRPIRLWNNLPTLRRHAHDCHETDPSLACGARPIPQRPAPSPSRLAVHEEAEVKNDTYTRALFSTLKGCLVKIKWCDVSADWPYFTVVDVTLYTEQQPSLILQGADYPDGSIKHEGDQFTAFASEIEKIEVVTQEADPTGRSAHEPGAKLDSGKLRAGLMLSDFPRALEALAAVTTYGAAKYSESGWVSVPDGEKPYRDALMRHLLAAQREECDAESGLPHLDHALWNVAALIELRERAK